MQNSATMFIFSCGLIGVLFALFLFWNVSKVSLASQPDDLQPLVSHTASDKELIEVYETIRTGAKAFLWAEYKICFIFGTQFTCFTITKGQILTQQRMQWLCLQW